MDNEEELYNHDCDQKSDFETETEGYMAPIVSNKYGKQVNPNLPGPANFVPFGTMRNSLFDINLISIPYIKFAYIYFSLFLNEAQTFLFAMIYDLPGYIIILTFVDVIDSRLTLDILKMGWVN